MRLEKASGEQREEIIDAFTPVPSNENRTEEETNDFPDGHEDVREVASPLQPLLHFP